MKEPSVFSSFQKHTASALPAANFAANIRGKRAVATRFIFLCLFCAPVKRLISKWECGDGLPELANIPPLCELLGVTADELLRGKRA